MTDVRFARSGAERGPRLVGNTSFKYYSIVSRADPAVCYIGLRVITLLCACMTSFDCNRVTN